MISFDDAVALVLNSIEHTLPSETVPLVLASGRVLAQAIVADANIPPTANSAMDGYAVRAEDVTQATLEHPVPLTVIGEAAAGTPFAGTVGHGCAVRIMTGGIIPEGATAVIEVEATSEADGTMYARRSLRPGEAIRAAGEDIRAGEVVLAAGTTIRPADVGLLASVGVVNVPVRIQPKIGILSTGNEIVEAFRTPGEGQIRNSTGPALYAACMALGAEPIDLGIVRDTRDELADRLEEGLRYDILITTGGVSAGAYDLVQHLLPELGVTIVFHKVKIRPGKPVLFGTFGDSEHRTLVFGLPGNPVSTLITFGQFVAPAVARMLGSTAVPLRLQARLAVPLRKTDDKRHFVRGILSTDAGSVPAVTTTGTQSSGALSSMSRANCLIVLDESSGSLESGDLVTVELL